MFYLKKILIIFIFFLFVSQTKAELKIDITSGYSKPTPIGISAFIGITSEEKEVSRQVHNLVKADLERSGLFRVIDPKAYIQKISSVNIHPRFSDWRIINAQALIVGQSKIESDGDIKIEFRLWDVFAEQQMAGWAFNTTRSNWRQISHRIADKIYERLTGEIGYFDTRIAYVAESGPQKKELKGLLLWIKMEQIIVF